jgi:hypothetical protein
MPKTVEMRVVFLVEDEDELLNAFDASGPNGDPEMPRSAAHAAMRLTELKGPPGASELRVFFEAGDTSEYEEGAHWLETPGVCIVKEREEFDTVKVVKVTSALVIEDEKLLHRVAEWTLNRRPGVEHGYKLLDEDGRIDVTECVMALYGAELPPGVSGPTDAYEMREFPAEQVRQSGFDFIRAFEA